MVDFEAHYQVKGYEGIAFWLESFKIDYSEESYEHDAEACSNSDCKETFEACDSWIHHEPEPIEDRGVVIAVMVGDNKRHEIDVEDLILLEDLDYCASCGQVGCTHDGRQRDG